jgi:hypothetical protein
MLVRMPAIVILASISVCLAATARAAGDRPLGTIVQTNNAHLDNQTAVAGADLYACDVLDTEDTGMIRAEFRGSQILLSSASEVVMAGSRDAVRIIVISGTVNFAAPQSSTLIVETPAGTLGETAGQAYAGTVTIENNKQLLVSSMRGDIAVNTGGEIHTVPAGKTARVSFDGAENATCQNPGDYVRSAIRDRRKIAFLIVGGAAAAAGGYFGWNELTVSPSKPQ